MSNTIRWTFSGDRLVEQEMGEVFSMYGGREKCIEDFDGGNWIQILIVIPRLRWKNNIKIDFMNQGVIINVGMYQAVRFLIPENLNFRELSIFVNWFVFIWIAMGGKHNADLVCKYSVI
jgi:hypothetical protein